MSIAVSIVEDDAGVRSSLVKLINSSPGYRCVSQHSSAENALEEIPKSKPDVTLMDINLPGIICSNRRRRRNCWRPFAT
jgi:DNA-binding NarL/FixJ family response regulator